MGIFDILAEAKIKEWLRLPKSETAVQSETGEAAEKEAEKTMEGYLLDQIRSLIIIASEHQGDARKQTIEKANDLQIQLLISLEQAGHHLMARETEKVILKHRLKYLP